MEEKKTKFFEILKRENSQIKDERADRIAQSTKEAHIKLILDKKAKVDTLRNKMENMLDLSASPDVTVDNKLSDFDPQAFVYEYQDNAEKLQVAQLKYEVAIKVGEDLFNLDIPTLLK